MFDPPEANTGASICVEQGELARSWDWELLDAQLRPRLVPAGVRRFGLTREEAEDVLQTAFTRVLQHNPRVRDPIAYVKRAFWHGCLNRLRSASRLPVHVEADETSIGTAAPCETAETADLVLRAFSGSDRVCRALVKHYFLRESTLASAAAAAGYAGKSIWRKVQRCLKAMRACLS